MLGRRVVPIVICGLALLPSIASADESPWAKGVSEDRKAAAENKLEEGNDLLLQNQYRDALLKYQEAIASWDHPAIRFNMVRALIALDRPLEAADNLDKALAYGPAALEENVYHEALNYQRLLAQELSTLQVSCKQDGVTISVDGAPFLACPGAKSMRTRAGTHVIDGAKAGYMPRTYNEVLLPGKPHPLDVSLVALGETAMRTRWAVWKPWAVAGVGTALVGAGVVLEILARSNSDAYETYLRTCPMIGCNTDDPKLALKSRAVTESRIAVGSLVVGGAALAAGIVLVVKNRPYAYVPEVTPGGGGVSMIGRF